MSAEGAVYVASIEVRPLPGAEMYGLASGGFVHCLIWATSLTAANERLNERLREDRYQLLDCEFLELFVPDPDQFVDQKSHGEMVSLASDCRRSRDVVYSDFHTYDTDEV